ncbi:secondary thiamine-phosphate synthase enzyme [Mesonia phycicola]|uniref:Secondary thiamine-phosphate synthase enzyme n=1 Tax=Mesonia phycicola TaxID=579105 RepID=A0A1M6A9F8_9FLAO|nr:secondary thiamine-phosphate synthase enzyme YjbQ [Mesonia phycicola]SHI33079.1 secondary thiamine-phosphate synthase enzyme [Mesonia phycicola]
MKIFQKELKLNKKTRGMHLVTEEVLKQIPEISSINVGVVKLFIKHTSAGLTINENADVTVREDFEAHLNVMVPENQPYYKHTYEGPDDMPAHIKSSLMGSSIEIPITQGRFNMGIWQGIYLCEFRNNGGSRKLIATIFGE